MSFSTGGSVFFSGVASASMAGSVTSDAIQLDNAGSVYIQLYFKTGSSPTGTFQLQSSVNGVDFDDVTDGDQAITDVGTHSYDAPLIGARYVRVKYTRTSGTGTLTGSFLLKGV